MNRRPNSKNPNNNGEDNYDVEKIVNQRVINGKRQYKVIWAGYSFEEATWEPQQNLNCPDKISEFLKRYQDVIRRKNLSKTNQPQSQSPPSQINQPQKRLQPPRTINPLQQNNPSNKGLMLNRQQLQKSLNKNNTPQKKVIQDIAGLKKSIMNPPQKQNLNVISSEIKNNSNSLSKITIPSNQSGPAKQLTTIPNKSSVPGNLSVIKIQPTSVQPNEKKITSQKPSSMMFSESKQKSKSTQQKLQHSHHTQDYEDQQINSQTPQFNQKDHPISTRQQSSYNNIKSFTNNSSKQKQLIQQQSLSFLRINERLDLQKIIGILCDYSINDQSQTGIFQSVQQMNNQYFIIKNKFSEEQKIVSGQRLNREQPLKLVQFYQSILMQN